MICRSCARDSLTVSLTHVGKTSRVSRRSPHHGRDNILVRSGPYWSIFSNRGPIRITAAVSFHSHKVIDKSSFRKHPSQLELLCLKTIHGRCTGTTGDSVDEDIVEQVLAIVCQNIDWFSMHCAREVVQTRIEPSNFCILSELDLLFEYNCTL